MKALLFRPGEPAEVIELEGFKHIQKLCGGFVERIVLDWSDGHRRYIQLWCNEDGISLGLPANLWAAGPAYAGAPIWGNAVLVAARRTFSDEEELGLTDEEVARWEGAFHRASVTEKARTGICPKHGRHWGEPLALGTLCNMESAACPKRS